MLNSTYGFVAIVFQESPHETWESSLDAIPSTKKNVYTRRTTIIRHIIDPEKHDSVLVLSWPFCGGLSLRPPLSLSFFVSHPHFRNKCVSLIDSTVDVYFIRRTSLTTSTSSYLSACNNWCLDWITHYIISCKKIDIYHSPSPQHIVNSLSQIVACYRVLLCRAQTIQITTSSIFKPTVISVLQLVENASVFL